MNRYTLINENRAAEFIEELEGVLNDKKQELANIENQIKEDFCGKIPKDLKRSLSEWSQIHKNEKWIEIKKEPSSAAIHPLSQSQTWYISCFLINLNGVYCIRRSRNRCGATVKTLPRKWYNLYSQGRFLKIPR